MEVHADFVWILVWSETAPTSHLAPSTVRRDTNSVVRTVLKRKHNDDVGRQWRAFYSTLH